MTRRTIFIIALVYLFVTLLLGLVFFLKRNWLWFVPDTFGPVPVGVLWFGALGAVLISLTGVFDHEHDWDPDYWQWHVSRPLIGLSLGVVSVIILKAGILAVGSTPNPEKSIPTNLLYYLIAFLVGYREETFRELIKRLVDVILSSGGTANTVPAIHIVNPNQAPHNVATTVVITGSGFIGTQSVKFGNSVVKFIVNSDVQLSVTTPTVAAAATISLTVTTKGGSASQPFTFT